MAISGSVKMVAATWPSRSGWTASPSACHIAIRPCMAATEASIITPVQSPAAYTPGAVVRDTLSTGTNPWPSSVDPGLLQARGRRVAGTMPDGEQAVRAADRPAVLQGDHHAVAGCA